MAFWMLTNTLPFSAPSLAKLLKRQVKQEPPKLREICPNIDTDLEEFIQKSLIKNADERISDWVKIRKLLDPVNNRNNIPLEADEIGIIIRLQKTSPRQSTDIIYSIRKMLREKSVNFSMETQISEED